MANGQGLCRTCHQVEEEPRWRHRVVRAPGEPHEVEITTPGAHTRRTRAPDPIGPHLVPAGPGRWVLAT